MEKWEEATGVAVPEPEGRVQGGSYGGSERPAHTPMAGHGDGASQKKPRLNEVAS